MNKIRILFVVCAALGLGACASSDANITKMSNVWHTTCGAGGESVVVSAPTLDAFHKAVEETPECAKGYEATAPSR